MAVWVCRIHVRHRRARDTHETVDARSSYQLSLTGGALTYDMPLRSARAINLITIKLQRQTHDIRSQHTLCKRVSLASPPPQLPSCAFVISHGRAHFTPSLLCSLRPRHSARAQATPARDPRSRAVLGGGGQRSTLSRRLHAFSVLHGGVVCAATEGMARAQTAAWQRT